MSTNLSSVNKAFFGISLIVASLLMLFWLASPAHAETFRVTETADTNDGTCDSQHHCTLREAITAANSSTGADTIEFAFGPGVTITLDSMLGQLPTITDTAGLTIEGGTAGITISGGNAVRVFQVGDTTNSAAQLTLKNLTVANGFATSPDPSGAGLFVLGGTATVTNSTFSGNSVIGTNQGSRGGAIFNVGTLTVSNSTFSGNSANGKTTDVRCQGLGDGGAINNVGTLTATNSTFSGNSATRLGGAIYSGGTLTLTGATFSGNSSVVSYVPPNDTPSCSTTVAGLGGALYNGSQTTIRNTIVANSPSGGNCVSGAGSITDGGYNIDDGTSCAFSAATSKSSTDPKLDTNGLQDNGGPTKTIALQPTSPAIDQGNSFGATTDQRGESRPHDFANVANASGGDASDIGAFELQPSPDTTPPSVSCSVSPSTLRLPANNHKLVNITATVTVSDSGGSGPNGFKLVSVTSNQADSGLARDDVPNDIQGWSLNTADTSGQLRAERYGADRVYTLTYRGYDLAGNSADCQATVTVTKPTKG